MSAQAGEFTKSAAAASNWINHELPPLTSLLDNLVHEHCLGGVGNMVTVKFREHQWIDSSGLILTFGALA